MSTNIKYDARRKDTKTNTKKMLAGSTLCPSQQCGEIYTKIKTEGHLAKLVAIIQFCSSSGYSLDDTAKEIKKRFGGYIRKTFDVNTLTGLINTYGEIGQAWGYGTDGDDIINIMIKNRAADIALHTDDIDDIEKFNHIYNENKQAGEERITAINFNLSANSGNLP